MVEGTRLSSSHPHFRRISTLAPAGKPFTREATRPIVTTFSQQVAVYCETKRNHLMSNANFHDRIQRINAKSQQPRATLYGGSQTAPTQVKKKPNLAVVFAGSLLMCMGLYIIKDLNEEYEVLRDSNGLGFITAFALSGVVFLLAGCFILFRAFLSKRSSRNGTALQSSENGEPQILRASGKAQTLSSVFGLILGVGACVCFLSGVMATRVATETGFEVFQSTLVVSISLLVSSILIGLVGVFLRGYALGRVPVYFAIGALATFSIVLFTGLPEQLMEYFYSALQ